MAPPGTKVLVHIKSSTRPTWGSHGREGWHTGPSLNHYRCVKCFISNTRAEIDNNTVDFFSKNINFPGVTIEDFLKQTASDIVAIFKTPPNPLIPSLQAGSDINNAIYDIASLLNNTNNTDALLQQAKSKSFHKAPAFSTYFSPLTH